MIAMVLDKDLIEEQQLLCEEFDSAYRAVKETDIIAIALHTLNKEPIVGLRKLPDENNVSWFIYGGELDGAEDFFELISVQELAKEFPEALPYLALDTGYRFMIDSDDYEDVWKEGDEA
ncbi:MULTISPECIES: hypothetical protein [Acinetobacter]|uniref:immunity protein Imm33 domain-containing protein n=1 Tax=Acinetobacter TaxID=469 RepID=UPI001D180BFF|nr:MULTISPECIES: hypothetical protein [Acinetobacter]